MSLLPFIFGNVLRPSRLLDQHFGLDLSPEAILYKLESPLISQDYFRPWRQLEAAAKDLGSTITSDKDKFQLNLDVQQFSPEELTVKTADGYVVIEGKHEEKEDEHGYISRRFVRRYALPKDCSAETVESRLSSDGVLTVVAPKKSPAIEQRERTIDVERTGAVRKQDSQKKTPMDTD